MSTYANLALQVDDYGVVRTRMLAQLGEMLSDLYTPVANTRINAMKWDDAHSTSDRIPHWHIDWSWRRSVELDATPVFRIRYQ